MHYSVPGAGGVYVRHQDPDMAKPTRLTVPVVISTNKKYYISFPKLTIISAPRRQSMDFNLIVFSFYLSLLISCEIRKGTLENILILLLVRICLAYLEGCKKVLINITHTLLIRIYVLREGVGHVRKRGRGQPQYVNFFRSFFYKRRRNALKRKKNCS